jgi:hypothetical protein
MNAPTRSQYANKADFDVARTEYDLYRATLDSVTPPTPTWTKTAYGKTQNSNGDWVDSGGRWTISNGHINFDVHVSFDGSGRKEQYPNGVIVSPEQADAYAYRIVEALNNAEVPNLETGV